MMKKSPSFIKSFSYARKGIIYTFRTQRNARIHGFSAIAVLLGAWYFHVSTTELMVIILTIVMVIGTEILNTAIEIVVNMFTSDYHPWAKTAKDVAAGAVLVFAIGAIIEGMIIFGPKIYRVLAIM